MKLTRKTLGIAAGIVLLVVICFIILATQYLYWGLVYVTKDSPEVLPVQYKLQTSPATTTILRFDRIELAVPWSEDFAPRISPDSAVWTFENVQKDILFISLSTTTTSKVILSKTPDSRTPALFSFDSQNTYDVEKMIWNVQKKDIPLWKTKNNNAARNVVLLSFKTLKYSDCDELLDFENSFGVKGVICSHVSEVEKKTSTIYFYLDNVEAEYSLHIKETTPTQVRDSIIASIKELH